ncbi:MAG TPA: sigma factor, partial [Pyrinomonadaceae bacterium]|nr:sigma factor [Pyrinomonadaceae bacterium]
MSAISSIDELIIPARANVARQSAAVAEPLSDHSLLEAARTGDEAAFAELVRRYRNQITNYVYRLTNDYESAVDLAQETFMRVFRAADR